MLKRLIELLVQPDPAESALDELLDKASKDLLSDDPSKVEQARRTRDNLGRVIAASDRS